MPTQLPENAPILRYSHRAKPFSSDLELELGARELVATRGRSTQTFPLAAIEQIALTFSPRNTNHLAFACKLRASDGKTLTFDSLSWKSMVETEKQDADYSRFVTALCDRAGKASPEARFHAGASPARYRLMLAFGLLTIAFLLAAGLYAFSARSWWIVGFAVALTAYFGWWLREYLLRNKPAQFRAGSIPVAVLPAS